MQAKAKIHHHMQAKAKLNQANIDTKCHPNIDKMHAKATCIDKIIHAKCLKIIDKMHANILLQMKMNQAKCHPIRLLTESYICSNSTYLVKCYYKMQPNMHASMCQIQNNTTLNIISWPMPPFKGFYKIGVFKCI